MFNNSNNINTKKTMTDDVVNPGPGLGQAQKGGGVKSVNGTPPTLDLNSDDNKINNNLTFECTYILDQWVTSRPHTRTKYINKGNLLYNLINQCF